MGTTCCRLHSTHEQQSKVRVEIKDQRREVKDQRSTYPRLKSRSGWSALFCVSLSGPFLLTTGVIKPSLIVCNQSLVVRNTDWDEIGDIEITGQFKYSWNTRASTSNSLISSVACFWFVYIYKRICQLIAHSQIPHIRTARETRVLQFEMNQRQKFRKIYFQTA